MCRIVSSDNLNGVTIVPNRFIDEFMIDADESQLKVYLYLLRFLYTPGVDIAFESVAEALDLTKAKVKKALRYWQGMGILRFSENHAGEIDRIYMEPVTSAGVKASEEKNPVTENAVAEDIVTEDTLTEAALTETEEGSELKPVKANVEEFKAPKKKNIIFYDKYTPEQMNEFAADEEFKSIIYDIEAKYYMPGTIKNDDILLLIGIYDSLGFSKEMIAHLYSYCNNLMDEDRSNSAFANYVKKVAISWAEKGIKTPEEQQRMEQQNGKLYGEIIKALGLRRNNLPALQNEAINKWIYEYQFPGDIILTACNKAIEAEVRQPFGYAKKILEDWHMNDVKSLKDVEKLEKKHKDSSEKEKKGKKQPYNSFTDYDFKKMTGKENDELVAKLIKKNEQSEKTESLEERLAGSKK